MTMTSQFPLVLSLCALVACKGFSVGELDGGGGFDASSDAPTPSDAPTSDGRGSDGAMDASSDAPSDGGNDAGPRDRCEPQNACEGSCDMPWLLAAAQDGGGTGSCGGWIFRYSLSESGACACRSYETGEQNLPTTVSYIPGGTLLVGTQGPALTFGASRSERSLGGTALDSFIVEGESPGSAPVGVVVSTQNGGAARGFAVFGADGTFRALPYDADQVLLRDHATQNPANRRGYRTQSSLHPSINRDFWEGYVEDPDHFARVGGAAVGMEAFFAGGLHRTAIVYRDGVRHAANAALTLDNAPALVACRESEYESCVYTAAAPDPSSEHHVFVACSQTLEGRSASRIARLDTRDDSCIDLLEFGHWNGIRISDLSIALESYWAP